MGLFFFPVLLILKCKIKKIGSIITKVKEYEHLFERNPKKKMTQVNGVMYSVYVMYILSIKCFLNQWNLKVI